MNLERLLKELDVIREGHFLLSSGLHSGVYFEKFRLLENPQYLPVFTHEIADHFKSYSISRVAAPTLGGMLIAYEVARELNTRAIYVEEVHGKRVLRRGFTIEKREPILVVDDVMTTGQSLSNVIEVIETNGGVIAGIGVLIDRSDGVSFPYPFFAVITKRVTNYTPDACPLCKQGVPLETPGGIS